ncbi:hypothetical protein CEUSTIGMA_g8357.t1 [Chlamydomonas eustigma]|uniref:DIRP domain-containing protein n=1 Tax=Chlamydomonas eustigma TaxID=1157962 RepID=A0A250XDH1_9CHLO|nr:hypothetical protein CEUSTIGMA_g8357.t1 [Chlamydomonas eustigma]|eukprot:GAX80922.1 hypothetical protein CEUSTIGMA_g8357.t1 [Chlamydomonas eustigma]
MVSGKVTKWDEESLRSYYSAFHKHGDDWMQVASASGPGKSAEMCENLHKQHQTFLGLPSSPALATAFVAMVQDHYNNIKDEPWVEEESARGTHGMDNGGDAVMSGADQDMDADDECASLVVSPRLKRTPKPSAKVLAASPGNRKGQTPQSARLRAAQEHQQENGSARKRRQRRLFEDEDQQLSQPSYNMNRWKSQHQNDDVGEGVDALLSLATAAAHNVSSSMVGVGGGATTGGSVTEAETSVAATGNATEGNTTAGEDAETVRGSGRRPPRASAVGVGHVVAGLMSSPVRSSGGHRGGRSTPGASGKAGTPTKTGKGGRSSGKGGRGGRSKKGAKRRYASTFSSESEGSEDEYGGEGRSLPMSAPHHRTSGSASEQQGGHSAPLPNGGRRARTGSGVLMPGGITRQASDSEGGASQYNPMMDQMPMDLGMYDFNSALLPAFDLTQFQGMNGMNEGVVGGLDIFSARPSQGTASKAHHKADMRHQMMMAHRRRRKPAQERMMGPMSPFMKALMPGGSGMSRVSTLGLTGTPTASSAAAAAAVSALSPGLLSSPGFLQGLHAPVLSEMASPKESALRHCLASHRVRRWCMFEFQFSALDRPWFLRNELSELLQLMCGGAQAPVPNKLTRSEWGILRSVFGKPRRFSTQFVKEERVKLEAYREHVRRIYDEAGSGSGLEVPAELPRPLRVGQAVVARHPGVKALHDGTILTVNGSKYRVQFNRSELMTEMVRDVDIMPVDPYENMPLNIPLMPAVLNGRPRLPLGAPKRRIAPRQIPRGAPSDAGKLIGGGALAAGAGLMHMEGSSELHAVRESDEDIINEMSELLDRKDALVTRLSGMNNEAETTQLDEQGQRPLKEDFRVMYAQLVLQLKEINSKLEVLKTRLTSRQAQVAAGGGNAAAAGSLRSGSGGSTDAASQGQNVMLNRNGGLSSSPIAAVPPGSAMASMPLSASALALAPGMVPQAGSSSGMAGSAFRADLQRLVSVSTAGPGTVVGAAAAASGGNGGEVATKAGGSAAASAGEAVAVGAGSSGLLKVGALAAMSGLSAPLSDSATTIAATILAVATSDAKAVVEKWKADFVSGAGAQVIKEEASGNIMARHGPPTSGVQRLVTGCIATLFTLQQCTSEAVSPAVVEAAMDAALRLLAPHAVASPEGFAAVSEHIKSLRSQLASRA